MNMRDILNKLDEVMGGPVDSSHMSRGWDLKHKKQIEGPYWVNSEEHDYGQYSYTLYKKVVDTDDPMVAAFQYVDNLSDLSSYRTTWPDVVASAKKVIAQQGS